MSEEPSAPVRIYLRRSWWIVYLIFGILTSAFAILFLAQDEPVGLAVLGWGLLLVAVAAGTMAHPVAEYDPETNSITNCGPFGLKTSPFPNGTPRGAGNLEAAGSYCGAREDGP